MCILLHFEEAIMDHSLKTGLSFGLTSAIITTLGLMVGLHSFSGSRSIILGGVLTIAIADACSDAFGIHIAEESETVHTPKEIWVATIATFATKFGFALTFIVPVFVFELDMAINIGIIWGMLVLTILSYQIAKDQQESPWKIIGEHIAIALLVVFLTHFVGDWITEVFV
jgi:VIT1/CCC1 family predicted Fe2+/Mn2+ transporter